MSRHTSEGENEPQRITLRNYVPVTSAMRQRSYRVNSHIDDLIEKRAAQPVKIPLSSVQEWLSADLNSFVLKPAGDFYRDVADAISEADSRTEAQVRRLRRVE